MTDALYHTDAYLKEFDATITAVDGSKVALDRTAFTRAAAASRMMWVGYRQAIKLGP